ncbi:MAG: arylsulfatase [Bacteroidota bacterium]
MNQSNIIFLLLSIILFYGCTPKKEKQEHPNIILVLADDLGYGDLGAYTEKCKIQTPHLDQIASEGILFTDAHTTSAVCTPTRYSILTGRYNWRSRLKNHVLTGKSKALISAERTTLASLLKKAGYHTAFIGKWHLGWDWGLKDSTDFGGDGWGYKDFEGIDFSKPITNNPNDLGFDYAYGHSGSLDMPPYVYVENGKVTKIPDTTISANTSYAFWRKGPISEDFIHEDVTPNFFRRSFDYIKKQAKTDEPFFLYLPLPSPHTPILPTEVWQGKSGLNPYGDFVMMIDDYMGQLAATIKAAGIEENTIVIFTSDNGCSPTANFDVLEQKGHAPNHIFRGHKADIYEGGHRVPFIVKWPDLIAKGTSSDQTICTADFLATFADIVGVPLQDTEGEDSYSLLPIFEQEKLETPIREATVHHSINGSFAIRKGDWKLIMCPGSGGWSFPRPNNKAAIDSLPPLQLYNLKSDPSESKNLQAENQEKVVELKALLSKYIVEGRSTPGAPQENDPINRKWTQVSFINE